MKNKIDNLKHKIWEKLSDPIGSIASWMLRKSRKILRWSHTHCSWCGAKPGFSSSVSRKGLRCVNFYCSEGYRNCEDFPDHK
jgi:hypothetical protein